MNTFNPMQIMQQMSFRGKTPQLFNGMNPSNVINPQQMMSVIPNLNKNQLSQFVMQARAQGIPEDQIEQGLNFLLSFR